MKDIRLYIEEENLKIYQKIKKERFTKAYFAENYEIFVLAMFIGKNLLNKRIPLNDKMGFIRIDSIKNNLYIFKSFVIGEEKDINVLLDIKHIFEICEEYANSGIKELDSWTVNEEVFKTKMSELLKNEFEMNEQYLNE